jgi:hypothetical protein
MVRRLPRPAPKTIWLDALTPADRAEAEAIYDAINALEPELFPVVRASGRGPRDCRGRTRAPEEASRGRCDPGDS